MSLTMEKIIEVGSQVLQRSTVDPEFRALALSDGSKAVEQVIGTSLPDALKIRFVENDGAMFTLGLPPLRTSGELSDRDLEAVAGGRDGMSGDQIAYQTVSAIAGVLGK